MWLKMADSVNLEIAQPDQPTPPPAADNMPLIVAAVFAVVAVLAVLMLRRKAK